MTHIDALLDENFEAVGEGTLDSKRRIGLAKAIGALHAVFGQNLKNVRFEISCNKAGQILLSPEASVPLHEAWLYKNSEALASVRQGITEAGRGKGRKLGSLAKYADDEIE